MNCTVEGGGGEKETSRKSRSRFQLDEPKHISNKAISNSPELSITGPRIKPVRGEITDSGNAIHIGRACYASTFWKFTFFFLPGLQFPFPRNSCALAKIFTSRGISAGFPRDFRAVVIKALLYSRHGNHV